MKEDGMYRTLRRHSEFLPRTTFARRLTRATPSSEVTERATQARDASTVAPLLGVSLLR
jgi:hypothetical protein